MTLEIVRRWFKAFPAWLSLVGIAGFVYISIFRPPILGYTPGEWDCACGDWYIHTTRLVIWNPFRERGPEIAAEGFLAGLRANRCTADAEVCKSALPLRRVSNWRLTFREDSGGRATLYFELTKFDSGSSCELGGAGVVQVENVSGQWIVTGYDAYF